MSLRYGIVYSWNVGRPPDSGRYRFTRKTTSDSTILVLPLHGLPLRDRHRDVVDPGRTVRLERERVLQVVRIVPLRKIGAAVRASGLVTIPRAVRDRHRDVEHEVELEDDRELRVEHAILVRESDGREAVPQLPQHAARIREGGFLSEDPHIALHELLHLDADPRDGLLAPLAPGSVRGPGPSPCISPRARGPSGSAH